MEIMRRILFFSLLIMYFTACRENTESEAESLKELRQQFWKDKSSQANVEKAAKLDSAYKNYINNNPEDTNNAEYLFENAKLHADPHLLNHPDVAINLLEQLYHKYPKSPRAPEAMYQTAYMLENILMLPDNARNRYQLVIDTYPDHPFAKEARVLVKYVGKDPTEALKAITDSASRNKPDTLAGKNR